MKSILSVPSLMHVVNKAWKVSIHQMKIRTASLLRALGRRLTDFNDFFSVVRDESIHLRLRNFFITAIFSKI